MFWDEPLLLPFVANNAKIFSQVWSNHELFVTDIKVLSSQAYFYIIDSEQWT